MDGMGNPNDRSLDESNEIRHFNHDTLERDFDRSPLPGTHAFTSRLLFDLGIMDGDEADCWKDEMKDSKLFEDNS